MDWWCWPSHRTAGGGSLKRCCADADLVLVEEVEEGCTPVSSTRPRGVRTERADISAEKTVMDFHGRNLQTFLGMESKDQ